MVVLFLTLSLASCISRSQDPVQTSLYIYRPERSVFTEFSSAFQPVRDIPFSIPPDCVLFNVYPSPIGDMLLIELGCPSGQTVLFLDVVSGSVTQPVTATDSHFLGWTETGRSVALRVDSLGDPHIIRLNVDTLKTEVIPVSGYTYDLAAQPYTYQFSFTFSRGMGYGSEMYLSTHPGEIVNTLYIDPYNYLSFAAWSPDSKQLAFIKIPDSQTPFTVGELWVVNEDGSEPRKLADADAGHGYAANWSPDGSQIAFVKRENPSDESANLSSGSLISNIYLVHVQSGELTQVTHFTSGHVETPYWSPDGNTLAFTTVLDGRMEVHIAEINAGEIRSLMAESTCCPAWMRK